MSMEKELGSLFCICALPLSWSGISRLYLLLLYICKKKKKEGLVSDFPSNSDVLLDCEP